MIVKMRRRSHRRFDQKACPGKTRWRTEGSAQRALTSLRKQHPGTFESMVRPYRCSACKFWHLGHGV